MSHAPRHGRPPPYTPEEWLRVLETLAGAEASVSWLIWNNTLPCFWARFLDEAGRARIFGDAKRLFAGSTRPTGQAMLTEGGFRLRGRWALVSGCELADYVHLMSLVHEDGVPRMRAPGQPDLRVLFVPKGHYDILDTWHVGGLTGLRESRRRRGRRVRARGRHIAPAPPVAGHSPLAQLPIIPVMTAGLGAQFLGMARAAIAVTLEILRTKVSVDPGASIRERPSVLADLAHQRGGHCRRESPPHQHGGHVGQRPKPSSDGRGPGDAIQRWSACRRHRASRHRGHARRRWDSGPL